MSFADEGQDSQSATFSPCAWPYLSLVPVIVGALILLSYSLRLLNPYRPTWTKPLLEESKTESDEFDDSPRHQFAWSTYALLAVASIGLFQQVSSVYAPVFVATSSAIPLIAWVSVQILR